MTSHDNPLLYLIKQTDTQSTSSLVKGLSHFYWQSNIRFNLVHSDINWKRKSLKLWRYFRIAQREACTEFWCDQKSQTEVFWQTYFNDLLEFLFLFYFFFFSFLCHLSPTRLNNILDLLFTTNPDLVDMVEVYPGMSDHSFVTAVINVKAKRNIYSLPVKCLSTRKWTQMGWGVMCVIYNKPSLSTMNALQMKIGYILLIRSIRWS